MLKNFVRTQPSTHHVKFCHQQPKKYTDFAPNSVPRGILDNVSRTQKKCLTHRLLLIGSVPWRLPPFDPCIGLFMGHSKSGTFSSLPCSGGGNDALRIMNKVTEQYEAEDHEETLRFFMARMVIVTGHFLVLVNVENLFCPSLA